MFKKINSIKNYGIFNNFDWDAKVRDKGNNVALFKSLNIIYGRNYSGKTTLSRIIRSFEKGNAHEKYPAAQFELNHSTDGRLTEKNLSTHQSIIRVYNKDFVTENLKWLTDEDGAIKPFAIIGEQNVEVENQIREQEELLGSIEDSTGLYGNHKSLAEIAKSKRDEKNNSSTGLDDKLRKKAQEIKNNTALFNKVTYNIKSIGEDISTIESKSIVALTETEIGLKKTLLKEQPKPIITEIRKHESKVSGFVVETDKLLQAKIKPTAPIQELLNDTVLALWVRTGMDYHKDKRETCGFCGQTLPKDLWVKLNAHFNKESEELISQISAKINEIEAYKRAIHQLVGLDKNQFYSSLTESLEKAKATWDIFKTRYIFELDSLISELEARNKDIFSTKILVKPKDLAKDFQSCLDDFNRLVKENNDKSSTLSQDQNNARNTLRLDEVTHFINDIDYYNEQKRIEQLTEEEKAAKDKVDAIAIDIQACQLKIEWLKIKLKDERKGADKVNDYLNHYFGHESLKLVAQEEAGGYKFVVKRGDEMAFNLSEGECSLVSFCYFMAKLEDTETKGKDLVIWIDDPICSLDSNHVFFVYSLIENIITKPHKNSDGTNTYKYKQLFISTHNLDFLKYLKRLSFPKNDQEYFLVDRSSGNSKLLLMPEYLRAYVTEFNFLFHQIYKCSIEDNAAVEHDCFYNFGNNLRKFLEAYLFYKYPVHRKNEEKLKMFFADDQLAFDLTNRLDNEMSHLEEIFDRSMKPIEIPEIPKLARYVLKRIEEKDKQQYDALLESIGVEPPAEILQ